MNFLSSTPKTNGPTWDDVIDKATKPQRRKIRFFRPHFEALDIDPPALTNKRLNEIVDSLPENAARDFFKIPGQRNRYAANELVRTLAALEDAHSLGLPKLTEMSAPQIQGVHWEAVIARGTKKRDRQMLRFFRPHFEKRGIFSPLWAKDEILTDILKTLPDNAAAEFCSQPNQRNGYAANEFIRALGRIEAAHRLGLPSLTPIPKQSDEAVEQQRAFARTYAAELTTFFATYRLPETLIEQLEGALRRPNERAKADVGLPITAKYRTMITYGLFNTYQYVATEDKKPNSLAALHSTPHVEAILARAKKDRRHATAVVALRSLAALSHHNCDIEHWRALNAAATEIHDLHGGNAISLELLHRLSQFSDIVRFYELGQALVVKAQMESYRDIETLHGLTRVSAAIAALILMLGPAAMEVIEAMTFSGRDFQGRPELWSEKHGRLEQPLHPDLRALITQFFFLFQRAHGVAPIRLLVGKDGQPRTGGGSSINKLLKRLEKDLAERHNDQSISKEKRLVVDLSASELRDLGVFRMACNGDDEETIARAARLSEKYVREHYRLMFDWIKSERKKSNER